VTNILLVGWYLWTNSAGEINWSRAQSDAPQGAAIVEVLPEITQLSLPELFNNGIAVLDDDGHAIELVPVGSEVIAIQVSNSPLDPQTRERMKREARQADREARKSWRDDNRLLADRIATNRADVAAISGTTAQQLTALRKELDDALQMINQLRRLVAELRKEQ
jgi:hypothetical protein